MAGTPESFLLACPISRTPCPLQEWQGINRKHDLPTGDF